MAEKPTEANQDPALLMTTLESYGAGRGTFEDVLAVVQDWQWAQRAPVTPEGADARLDPPGSFADIETALYRHLITIDEYKQLFELTRESRV